MGLPDIDYAGIVSGIIKAGGQHVDNAADLVGFKKGPVARARAGSSPRKGTAAPQNVPRRGTTPKPPAKPKPTGTKRRPARPQGRPEGLKSGQGSPVTNTGAKRFRRETKPEQGARAQRTDRRNRNQTDAQRRSIAAAKAKSAAKLASLKTKRSKARKAGNTKKAHRVGRRITRRTERGDT
jgi:hypothetical protein